MLNTESLLRRFGSGFVCCFVLAAIVMTSTVATAAGIPGIFSDTTTDPMSLQPVKPASPAKPAPSAKPAKPALSANPSKPAPSAKPAPSDKPADAAPSAKPAPPAIPPPPVRPAPVVINSITESAVKSGVLACVDRINQLANFLTSNRNCGVFLFVNTAQPNQSIFSASLEVEGKDGATSYSSMSFAPNQANGCGALYETVSYSNKSPDELVNTQFPNLKRVCMLSKDIIVLDAGPTARIFIMPAGSGCVYIQKEVVQ